MTKKTSLILYILIILLAAGCSIPSGNKYDGPPRIKFFRASPNAVQSGETASLRWSTQNANQVEITGIGNVALEGTRQVIPEQQTTYTLRARNNAGVATRSVSVRVLPNGNPQNPAPSSSENNPGHSPRIVSFSVTPPSVRAGETVTLQWRTRNANQVEITGIGSVALEGTRQVIPDRQTTYTIRARNNAEIVTSSVSVRTIPEEESPPTKSGAKPVKSKALEKTSNTSSTIMAAPKHIVPANGSTFAHYPRRIMLRWKPVKGAATYTVHIQYAHSRGWDHDVDNLIVESGITETSYRFNFVGAQPGRWRVWAVNANGESGYKSKWWYFNFTR
jgi:hypothetical protein